MKQILATYTVADLKDGLRVKGLKLTGLKQDLVDRLANSRDMPSEKLLDYVLEIMNKQGMKPRIQAILTEEAVMAWLTSARATTRSG